MGKRKIYYKSKAIKLIIINVHKVIHLRVTVWGKGEAPENPHHSHPQDFDCGNLMVEIWAHSNHRRYFEFLSQWSDLHIEIDNLLYINSFNKWKITVDASFAFLSTYVIFVFLPPPPPVTNAWGWRFVFKYQYNLAEPDFPTKRSLLSNNEQHWNYEKWIWIFGLCHVVVTGQSSTWKLDAIWNGEEIWQMPTPSFQKKNEHRFHILGLKFWRVTCSMKISASEAKMKITVGGPKCHCAVDSCAGNVM